MYDFLIVGAGIFGSICAYELERVGRRCLVIDKRNHVGGNMYCVRQCGINTHHYGPHIFHTSKKHVWSYIQNFATFNHFINSPIANYKGALYNLPFNMNTFYRLWGTVEPMQAKKIINEQCSPYQVKEPQNLEEQALSLVGKDIYDILICGYTEKQWGKPCRELPPSIIKRIPLRFSFDNNYYTDTYQGIPIGGYNSIFDKLLAKSDVRLGIDYLKERAALNLVSKKIIYSGQIDAFFDYSHGALAWRGLRFETQELETDDFQGNAIVNYTDRETPHTRIIEHKHFELPHQENTVITFEYPTTWKPGDEAYYPINDQKNQRLYEIYKRLAEKYPSVVFGGRLGSYAYYDMDQVSEAALQCVSGLLAN